MINGHEKIKPPPPPLENEAVQSTKKGWTRGYKLILMVLLIGK